MKYLSGKLFGYFKLISCLWCTLPLKMQHFDYIQESECQIYFDQQDLGQRIDIHHHLFARTASKVNFNFYIFINFIISYNNNERQELS